VPDPEEAKKKAAEMAASAGDALAKSQADLMKVVFPTRSRENV
jgi:hypothetical protein